MAQLFASGPVWIYVGVGPTGSYTGAYPFVPPAAGGPTGGYTGTPVGGYTAARPSSGGGAAQQAPPQPDPAPQGGGVPGRGSVAAGGGGYVPLVPDADATTVAAGIGQAIGSASVAGTQADPPRRYSGGYTPFFGSLPAGTPESAIASTSRARPRLGRSPLFLGTCEDPPEALFQPIVRAVRTDWSCEEPDDVSWLGETAHVFAHVNYYNAATYLALASRPAFYGTRGYTSPFDRGTLLRRAGLTYPVYLVFPYVLKGRMKLAGMVPGYRFLECYIDEDGLRNLGTAPKTLVLAWHAIRNQNGFLYDHVVTGLPNPV